MRTFLWSSARVPELPPFVVQVQRKRLLSLLILPLFFVFCHGFTNIALWLSPRSAPRRTPARCCATAQPSWHPPEQPAVTYSYLATCVPGLSHVLATEIAALGDCRDVVTLGTSAVSFRASLSSGVRVVVWARTAHKVLQQLPECPAARVRDRDEVYAVTRSLVSVQELLPTNRPDDDEFTELLTFSVQVILVANAWIPRDIIHSHFTALMIKNALCDACRDQFSGQRPSIDTEHPQVPLVAVLRGLDDERPNSDGAAELTLYRQLHIGSLHQRGYRPDGVAIHKAAMKESLAAGLLYLAGWDRTVKSYLEELPSQHNSEWNTNNETLAPLVLMDPMAGSGTLLLEATLMAANVAPGILRWQSGHEAQRRPPFLEWTFPDATDPSKVWKEVLVQAAARAQTGLQRLKRAIETKRIRLVGNDIHPGAIFLFESALRAANLQSFVEVHCGDCAAPNWLSSLVNISNDQEEVLPPTRAAAGRVMVVTNPPWGEQRLSDDTHASWEALRVCLRQSGGAETEAWVLSGHPAATKHLGLRKSQTHVIRTGQQDLRWLQYVIYNKDTSQRVERTILNNKDREVKKRFDPPKNNAQWSSRRSLAIEKTMSHPRRSRPFKVISKPIAKERNRKSSKGEFDKNDWLV